MRGSTFQRLYNTLMEGAERYGPNTWQGVEWEEHTQHAIEHLYRATGGYDDSSEDHLAHAFCRILFALEGQHADDIAVKEGVGQDRISIDQETIRRLSETYKFLKER